MQNFMPGGGGAAGGAGYGPPAGGMPMMHQMPQPTGTSTMHINSYKAQLTAFQQNQTTMFQQMAANGQITQAQMQQQIHAMNEKIRSNFGNFVSQIQQQQHHQQQQQQHQQQQQQQQGRFPQGQPEWRGPMPPPQVPPGGQMQMSAAEKKKMAEMQKRNMMQQQQQQQAMRMPPGATPQQQHQYRMMQMQQQQQQQQNAGYRMPMQPGQTQYPGMQQQQQPMGHAGMQPLQHMQPPTPQSHGPASVSNPAQQQFQQQQHQQQQQQYYQQQQNQQMHMQHMQQQQQQHQMAQQQSAHDQQMAPPSQMGQMQMQQPPQQQQAPVEAPPPQKPEDVKYKELLREMKTQYLEVLHGMHRRNSQTRGLVQMINILEGDREVPYERLLGLKNSVALLLARDCPTFPLLEEIRRVVFKKKEDREREQYHTVFCDKESLAANCEAATKRLNAKCSPKRHSSPLGVEPWCSVRHLHIRVPEAVRMLTARAGSPSPLDEKRKALKRGREEEKAVKVEEGVEAKKAKAEEEAVVVKVVEEDYSQLPDMFVIKTVFDTRRPWVIPKAAREELLQLTDWSIDEHCLPSCSESPFIVVCIKSRTLHVSPLRIILPNNYPTTPVTIQYDRSFPRSSEHGAKLQLLFEKRLGAMGAVTSITQHAAVFQAACEELHQFLPKYLDDSSPETSLQSQKTPEPVYPVHYTARPAATNAIAHKGMVM